LSTLLPQQAGFTFCDMIPLTSGRELEMMNANTVCATAVWVPAFWEAEAFASMTGHFLSAVFFGSVMSFLISQRASKCRRAEAAYLRNESQQPFLAPLRIGAMCAGRCWLTDRIDPNEDRMILGIIQSPLMEMVNQCLSSSKGNLSLSTEEGFAGHVLEKALSRSRRMMPHFPAHPPNFTCDLICCIASSVNRFHASRLL
jgi:hypothetical protein